MINEEWNRIRFEMRVFTSPRGDMRTERTFVSLAHRSFFCLHLLLKNLFVGQLTEESGQGCGHVVVHQWRWQIFQEISIDIAFTCGHGGVDQMFQDIFVVDISRGTCHFVILGDTVVIFSDQESSGPFCWSIACSLIRFHIIGIFNNLLDQQKRLNDCGRALPYLIVDVIDNLGIRSIVLMNVADMSKNDPEMVRLQWTSRTGKGFDWWNSRRFLIGRGFCGCHRFTLCRRFIDFYDQLREIVDVGGVFVTNVTFDDPSMRSETFATSAFIHTGP